MDNRKKGNKSAPPPDTVGNRSSGPSPGKRKAKNYAMAPNAFVLDPSLSAYYRLGYVILQAKTDTGKTDRAYMSPERFARILGCKKATAYALLKEYAEDKNLGVSLIKRGGGFRKVKGKITGQANLYHVPYPYDYPALSLVLPGTGDEPNFFESPVPGRTGSIPPGERETTDSPVPPGTAIKNPSDFQEPQEAEKNPRESGSLSPGSTALVRLESAGNLPALPDQGPSLDDLKATLESVDPARLTPWEAELVTGVGALLTVGERPSPKQIANLMACAAKKKVTVMVEKAKAKKAKDDEKAKAKADERQALEGNRRRQEYEAAQRQAARQSLVEALTKAEEKVRTNDGVIAGTIQPLNPKYDRDMFKQQCVWDRDAVEREKKALAAFDNGGRS